MYKDCSVAVRIIQTWITIERQLTFCLTGTVQQVLFPNSDAVFFSVLCEQNSIK